MALLTGAYMRQPAWVSTIHLGPYRPSWVTKTISREYDPYQLPLRQYTKRTRYQTEVQIFQQNYHDDHIRLDLQFPKTIIYIIS